LPAVHSLECWQHQLGKGAPMVIVCSVLRGIRYLRIGRMHALAVFAMQRYQCHIVFLFPTITSE
jgi:hypothetical protein